MLKNFITVLTQFLHIGITRLFLITNIDKKYILIALLATYMLLSRFLYIDSIPGYLWDEGGWTIGAKNFVLFGKAAFGDVYFHYTSPFYHLMTTSVFSIFGPSIINARILSSLLGILSLILLFLVVKRLYNEKVAFLSVLLLTFNGIMTISNRTAMLETPQVFLMLLTTYLWLKGKSGFRIMAVMSFVCAILLKANSLYFAVPISLLTMSSDGDLFWQKPTIWFRNYRLFFFIAMPLLVCSIGLFILFDRQQFIAVWTRIMNFHYKSAEGGSFLQTLKYFLVRMPFEIMLTCVAFVYSVKYYLRKDAFILSWLGSGILMHAMLRYQPYWYYFTIIPAVCVLISHFIYREFLEQRHVYLKRIIGVGAITLICLFQVSGIVGYYFILGHRDDSAARIVEYIGEHINTNEVIMTPHYVGVSIKNPTVGPSHSERKDIKAYNVAYIIVDRKESDMMKINNDHEFLSKYCERLTQIKDIEIYGVIKDNLVN
jgi:4-amino-4-deoxy-L-arabinose transferase-like glycosyltransferase